jgi:hypothetical protein
MTGVIMNERIHHHLLCTRLCFGELEYVRMRMGVFGREVVVLGCALMQMHDVF